MTLKTTPLSELPESRQSGHERGDGPAAFGFSLNFISGRALLSVRDRSFGGIELKFIELEVPDISFPFDVTGGAERFKTRRCSLKHLVFSVDAAALEGTLEKASLSENGFVELKAAVREGYVELAGRFRIGEAQADFTMRAAPVLRSPEELALVFYDTRIYGFLPVPSALLPVYLHRALNQTFINGERAGMWLVRPAEYFVQRVLPLYGWKIPDTKRAQIVAAEAARGRITVAAGPEGDLTQKQVLEREPPTAAVRASEGMIAFSDGERALGRGAIQDAYQIFRDAVDDERGGRWARERLLQIGAADPELALETRQLADEALRDDPQDTQALLALAAIALREHSWGEAANRYAALAEAAHQRKERLDIVGAELAAAAAAAPVDPAGALAAYERAAARARDSVVAHQALFDLRLATSDWEGAVRAGERLVQLLGDETAQAQVHRQLGEVHRRHLRDLKHARVHFERALRLMPDDPAALEGLAETYAARGEPGRATSYLARLAEQAETSGDKSRIVALNLRLGDIWERWLSDADAASTRYYRVLEVDAKNRTARLRLAALAEAKGDIERARSLYEDVLAGEEETSADPEVVADLVAAYTRLARVTLSTTGGTGEAIAWLERAVELDPTNKLARDELAKLLRARRDWGRLLHVLQEAARVATTPEEARRVRLEAARLEATERHNPKAAQQHLEAVLDVRADDAEALELLLPVLTAAKDHDSLRRRLHAAADTTLEPERKAALLLRLFELQGESASATQILAAALDANPFLAPAAEALVRLYGKSGSPEQRAASFLRLAVAAPAPAERAAALLARAEILWRELNRAGDAERALHEAAQQDAANLDVWSLLASLREASGDLEPARAALAAALKLSRPDEPRRAELLVRLAAVAKRLHDFESQTEYLMQAIAAGARPSELRADLVEALRELGRSEQLAGLLEEWGNSAQGDEADRLYLESAALRDSLGGRADAVRLYGLIVGRKGAQARLAAQALERIALDEGDYASVARAIGQQLEIAPEADHKSLLLRLLNAQLAGGDAAGAEATCLRLSEIDPKVALAHRYLAECAERAGEFKEALEHWRTLLLACDEEGSDRSGRRQDFERAAALAHDVGPTELPALQRAFDDEFPEAPPTALARTFGEILAEAEEYETLLALRRYQIGAARDGGKSAWREEAAAILDKRLNRPEEAVALYQDIVAHHPDAVDARDRLIAIYEKLGRDHELAQLLFAVSQLTANGDEALKHGLRSAELYADKLADVSSGVQVLRLLSARADIDPDDPALHEALRRHNLVDELTQLLERSITASPDPEDGRLSELVQLFDHLGDVPRAQAWCERMIEAFAPSDTPRQLLVNLLLSHPEAGDALWVMRSWADARSGAARAKVLLELAAHEQAAGDPTAALQALEDAAAADPRAEAVLTQLVDRYTASGAFDKVVLWLEKLALAAEPGSTTQDERWRRLLEVATDYADDRAAAIRALESLGHRTEDEGRLLAQLYIDTGSVEGLLALARNGETLSSDLLLKAADSLTAAGRFDDARSLFEQAVDHGGGAGAWDAAAIAFERAGRLEELGRWRLKVARRTVGQEGLILKLLGYADIHDATGELPDNMSPQLIEALGRDVDLTRVEAAWALFRAARAFDAYEWLDLSCNALLSLLAESDPRLRLVVRTRMQREIAANNADAAVTAAERLVAIGDPEADRFLEEALTFAGRKDDLLAFLTSRAEAAADGAPALWVRIATLQDQNGQPADAIVALERIAADARTATWGELMCRVARAVGDAEREALGAQVCARAAGDDATRAQWLRKSARILWWGVGDETRARDLITEAHRLAPELFPAVQARIVDLLGTSDAASAEQAIAEALVVFTGTEAAALRLLEAQLHQTRGDDSRAREALAAVEALAGDNAPLWGELGRRQRQLGDADAALAALMHAAELDRTYAAEYLTALEEEGRWSVLCETLAKEATSESGAAAAKSLTRAANIALDYLDDRVRALDLFGRALACEASLDVALQAFRLAVAVDDVEATARLGTTLLGLLPADAGDRGAVLRANVDALVGLGRAAETTGLRDELLTRGEALAADKLHLGRACAADAPGRAAALIEEAAADPGAGCGPEVFLETALLWERAAESGRAATMLQQALAGGVDDTAGHAAAVRLLAGEARLASLAKVLEREADGEWPPEERAKARVELAVAAQALGDAERARTLLAEAVGYGKVEGWALAMEQALTSLEQTEPLAELYVAEIEQGSPPWSEGEQVERLRRAAAVFLERSRTEDELRALELLRGHVPADPEVNERLAALATDLGDDQRYVDTVRAQLAAARVPKDRAVILVRAAAVLGDRFNKPESALEMLLPELEKRPTAELAGAAEKLLALAGRAAETPKVLASASVLAEPPVRHDLLSRAAGLAATAPGGTARAYEWYRELLTDTPADPTALAFCLEQTTAGERWAESITLLENAAGAADGHERYDFYARAATIARERLKNGTRELSLLRSALTAAPEEGETAARVIELCLERNELLSATDVLRGGSVAAEREIAFAVDLIARLRATQQPTEAEELTTWFEERHPETTQASNYRLERLRTTGDAAGLLAELSRRLETDTTLPPADAAAMHAEAAAAAKSVGDSEAALLHMLAALRGAEASVEVVFEAWRLARALASEQALHEAVQRAAAVRDSIFSRAAAAKGADRTSWLELLGEAMEAAGDDMSAIGAFSQAMVSTDAAFSPIAATGLARLHAKRGEWEQHVELLEKIAQAASTAAERADSYYRAALACRDHVLDEGRTEAYLSKCLAEQPTHKEAQLAYGLLLRARNQFAKALPYLEAQIDPEAADTPTEHTQALAECLRHGGQLSRALELTEKLVARDPTRAETHARYAELLEATGHDAEAETAWLKYIEVIGGPAADQAVLESVYRRIAQAALRRDELAAATRYFEEAFKLRPDAIDLLSELRALYEHTDRWAEAAELRLREATLAEESDKKLEHYRALAGIYREQLSDESRGAAMLEKALELVPNDTELMTELVELYAGKNDWPKLLAVGEKLLVAVGPDGADAQLLSRVAFACEEAAGDAARAKELYGRALALDPDSAELKQSYRRLALESGDYKAFAALEEKELAGDITSDEHADRLQGLVDVYLKHLASVDEAAAVLQRLAAYRPDDQSIVRRLADAYALEARTYPKAAETYRRLLGDAPLDPDLLRILARLSGQVGDTDRAYGYYAALLTLLPQDSEAQRFVGACRGARPPGPQRALTDADRAQGLVHPGQITPIEEVFTPLARFAELTHPGDVQRRGIVPDRDTLGPTDARRQYLMAVLEPLGVPQATLYLWRAGGFVCEVELTQPPAVLIGSLLAEESAERQRAFLVARAAEMYRSGHTLCERLSLAELSGVVAALCGAVVPGASVPGASNDTPKWTQIVGAPMNDPIRAALAPKVQAYLEAAGSVDVGEWRRACLCTAARTALLVSCDIDEAIAAMLRVRGFEEIADDQRIAMLREAPEELDLLRFAISDAYFKLRQALGLALRRSK